MNKKILLIVLVVAILVLVGGGYYYWKVKMQKSSAEQAAEDLQKTIESINADVTGGILPNMDISAEASAAMDAVGNAPDANPYSNTNPFSNVKVNPFE